MNYDAMISNLKNKRDRQTDALQLTDDQIAAFEKMRDEARRAEDQQKLDIAGKKK